jgi:hypothetical protein
MIRSFTNSFEKLLKNLEKKSALSASETIFSPEDFENVRTHKLAVVPNSNVKADNLKPEIQHPTSLHGTILTGEMFAPILRQQVEKLNA